eukprot:TRINITY_DN1335_c0_g1_i3.p1 TRINITY_DN1335_c0_g1~~TRINITY_DN1335_c0_g1_i3.p1  ORF type:complete len:250 (-),score=49.71 TRINITY_DN1335_c0_g1_i3:156-905(-)
MCIRDRYYGKGLMSKKLYSEIQAECQFKDLAFNVPNPSPNSAACEAVLAKAWKADDPSKTVVGPHNTFNVYDNCPADPFLDAQKRFSVTQEGPTGGFTWTCGQFEQIPNYLARAEVRAALHLPSKSLTSNFKFNTSGPASVTLYPSLIPRIRVLIYNGDADPDVPYIGNEEWTVGMETLGVVKEKQPWHPWYLSTVTSMPAGYATTYSVPGKDHEFSFVTVRLAGHEVPHYLPQPAFELFSKFLQGQTV